MINFNDLPTDIHRLIFQQNRNDAMVLKKEKDKHRKLTKEILDTIRDDMILEEGFFWWGKEKMRKYKPLDDKKYEEERKERRKYNMWWKKLDEDERQEIQDILDEYYSDDPFSYKWEDRHKEEKSAHDLYMYPDDGYYLIESNDFTDLPLHQKKYFYDRYWKMNWFHYRMLTYPL